MNQQDKKIPLKRLDDLFTTQQQRDDIDKEKVTELSISEIDDFPHHPFKVINNDEMSQMKESIAENGVLLPILVRPKENGRYEIISGHRRKFASKLAEKETIPCIIRNLSDDEATIVMVDSNMQREKILPSERAFAYKMKLDAISHQGKRNDLTSDQIGPKSLRSNETLAKEVDESTSNIKRYIRLTKLIPELLQYVDDEKIALSPAVYISFLSEDHQRVLLDCIECNLATPSVAQALKLKRLSDKGKLTPEIISDTLSEPKPNQVIVEKIEFNEQRIRSVLPTNIERAKIENYVVNAVSKYQKIKEILPPKIDDSNIEIFVMRAISHYIKYADRQKNMDAR